MFIEPFVKKPLTSAIKILFLTSKWSLKCNINHIFIKTTTLMLNMFRAEGSDQQWIWTKLETWLYIRHQTVLQIFNISFCIRAGHGFCFNYWERSGTIGFKYNFCLDWTPSSASVWQEEWQIMAKKVKKKNI